MIYELAINFAALASRCTPRGWSNFLSFPTWYKYLPGTIDANGRCTPAISNINDVWLIVAAGIEILIRVAAILAFFMIIYAAFSYTMSQGEPDATAKAKDTLINAILGLAISVSAIVIVNFIARSFS